MTYFSLLLTCATKALWLIILQQGTFVTESVSIYFKNLRQLRRENERIRADPGLRTVLINPRTDEVWKKGDVYTFPLLGDTLSSIAAHGPKVFYEGEIGQKLVADIQAAGGIITMEDMKNYKVRWESPVEFRLQNLGYTVLSSPPPGSGSILTSILAIMDSYNLTPLDINRPLTWHRFTEACKFAYAMRTKMGDSHCPDIQENMEEIIENMTSQVHLLVRISDLS